MLSNPGTLSSIESLTEGFAGDYASDLLSMYPVTNDKEAADTYNKLSGLIWFGYSHYDWSKLMTAEGRNAYMYYFSKENKALGPWHSGELPYMYGNLHRNPGSYDESDYELSNMMQGYLLNFVKYGDPNGLDADGNTLPIWETFGDAPDKYMSFGDEKGMITDEYLPLFELIGKYQEGQKDKQ